MLYHLLYSSEVLNVFQYITFRTAGALITALAICWLFYPWFIGRLRALKAGQTIRTDGPEGHLKKQGTPTMGGLFMMFAVALSTLVWGRLDNPWIWGGMTILLGFGAVGFADDYAKIRQRGTDGLSGKLRLLLEFLIAGAVVSALVWRGDLATEIQFPFFKAWSIDPGWGYVGFASFIIVGCANGVNLTDGLDGLAIGPIMMASLAYAILAYLAGSSRFANYLYILPVEGAAELTVFGVTLVGAGLGFLWYNAPPAQVFMGDTGSLPLGGVIGAMAVFTKNEILLGLIGGLFLVEAMSVILQVGSYKLRRKRIFLMAPIHHHFEKKGWEEPTVVMRFWIVSVVLALLGLMTLKLR